MQKLLLAAFLITCTCGILYFSKAKNEAKANINPEESESTEILSENDLQDNPVIEPKLNKKDADELEESIFGEVTQ